MNATPATHPLPADDGEVEFVDFQDVLRAAIAEAGGNEAFAKAAGVGLLSVWWARDDREPHWGILNYLGLSQVTYTYRRRKG